MHLAWHYPLIQCSAAREEMTTDLVTMAMCMLLSFTRSLNGSEEPLGWGWGMLACEEAGKHALTVCFGQACFAKWAAEAGRAELQKAHRPLLLEERDLRDTQSRPGCFLPMPGSCP